MAVVIRRVRKSGVAFRRGVRPGEVLQAINGHEIMDVLDYRFYEANAELLLTLQDALGKTREVRIKKGEYDEIGLEFETYLMDKQHSCRNRCVFCFIDQMPKGMRETLYFKDDDSRLSFLFGNYITLTNLSEHEISRIISMHISPVNISVHTMNPELRVKMMGNRFAGETLSILQRFAKAGIRMNTQLVLCPGINDGDELAFSLRELGKLAPSVESIAVVPVGLTKYREGLTPISPYKPDTARAVVEMVERFGDAFWQEHGTRLAYPADEFYLKAGLPLPGTDFYEEFPQLENGVGMLALLEDEFSQALEDAACPSGERHITIATGVAAAPFMEKLLLRAKERMPGLSGEVVPVENRFFGERITVSGLLTGRDLMDQLSARALGEELLLPACALRHEGDRFLDDVTLEQLEEAVGAPVRAVPNDGTLLLEAMIGSE